MSKKIAITGATGFIGRHSIGPLLARGFEVHLLCRAPRSVQKLNADVAGKCRMHAVDVLSQDAVSAVMKHIRASHLLHFAWHGDPASRWASPANMDWAAATLWLASAFARNGGERMVVSGSCAEYDWRFHTLTEDKTPYRPASLYGTAKAATRELLGEACKSLHISFAWGHVFFCYGPGEPAGRLLSDVITNLLAGKDVACTDGLQVRDYMHVKDIGRAFSWLADSTYSGALNIASGQGVRVRDLVEAAATRLNRLSLVKFGARPRPLGDPPYLVGDVSRLRQALDFTPEFDLNRGVEDTVAWYRQHRSQP